MPYYVYYPFMILEWIGPAAIVWDCLRHAVSEADTTNDSHQHLLVAAAFAGAFILKLFVLVFV